jgi:hypothetical protein
MSITLRTAGKTACRALAVATASLALMGGAHAQGHGWVGHGTGGAHYVHGGYYHGPHHGYRGHGWGWGGLGLGIGLGLAAGYYASPWYAEPGYVVVAPPPVIYTEPRPVPQSPQPVIYPRNGQSAEQIDADSNACSEWAGKQPNATTDPSVFRRGITACMDARGYTLR